MCTGLFGPLELHWCNGLLGVLAAGVLVPKSEQYTDLNFDLSDMWFSDHGIATTNQEKLSATSAADATTNETEVKFHEEVFEKQIT